MNDHPQQHAAQALDADMAAALAYRPAPTFPELLDPAPAPAPRAVVLACGTDLKPEPVRWLWRDWLALGKLHILAGAPGQGKTTLALAMGATITVGGLWPDGTRCERGNILVWSGEDDPADTLLPRLLAAGADRARCFFIEGTRSEDGTLEPFDPAADLPRLQEAVDRIGGVRLLVVDPIVSAVTGDSHKNTEVRRALQPVVDLAAACGFAVLGITHFSKGGQGGDPAQRVVGSVAFTAVARVVLVAAKVKGEADGEDRRILARSKSNLGPDDGGFEYRLEQREPIPGLFASCVAWDKAVTGTARELLTDPDDEASTDGADACAFLASLLVDGPMTAKEIFKDADGCGFSRDQIKRASLKLGIEKRKTGMGGGWQWAMPSTETPEGSRREHEGSSLQNALPSHPSALPSAKPDPEADSADRGAEDVF